jgi:Mg2+ and Co2+ transporter CorA
MNTPFEDHHKIVTKNEALLTAAQRYATRARNALTKARIELQARLHDTNVSTAWPLAMARRAYDKCKAEFQEALKHLRHYSAILRNLYNEYAKYIIRNTYTA